MKKRTTHDAAEPSAGLELLQRRLQDVRDRHGGGASENCFPPFLRSFIRAVYEENRHLAGILSPQGTVIDANRTACELAGVSLADVAGTPFWDTPWWSHLPAEQERVRKAIHQASTCRETARFQTTHSSADGSLRTIDFLLKPVFDDFGALCCLLCEGEDVTALTHAVANWRSEESVLRSVFKATPIGITFNIGRVIVSVNDAMCRLMRREEKEMLGNSARIFYDTDEEFARVGRELYHDLQRRGPRSVETRFRRGDGAEILVVLNAAMLRQEDPSAGHVVTVQDVTERHKAVDALRRSEERYRLIAENTADTIAVLDLDLDLTYVSPSVSNILGYSPVELMNGSLTRLLSSQALERARAEFRRRMEREARTSTDPAHPLLFEMELLHRDGTIRQVEIAASLLRSGDGTVERVLAVMRDISERRRAEDARRESESRFRVYFEQGLIGMALTSADAMILEANEKLCQLLGYTRGELVGAPWTQMVHAEDLPFTLERFRSVLRGEIDGYFLEKRLLRKDGEVVHAAVSVRCIRRGDGVVASFVELVQDITERKRAEQERERLQGQLRQAQKMESIGRLAGGVAHDFNNLLAPVLGYADLLLLEPGLDPEVRQDLEQIHKAAERARDLTRQLLAFGRKQILSMIAHDLREVVSEFEPLLRRTIREEISLVVVAPRQPLMANVDAGQIQQVLMNLAVNAQDAIDGPGTITMELGEAVLDVARAAAHPEMAPGQYAILAVSDTGCGMDPTTQGRLFEPFFTTKAESRGTGLGLSTVFGIIKQHGGHITVYSEPGVGSTFRVYLPLLEGPPVLDALRATTDTRSLNGRGTVLVVEDSDAVRNLAVKMVSALGYRTLAAETPQRAAAVMDREGNSVDLLLTDVVMPIANGRELYRQLSLRFPKLKVLYMSGYTEDAIAQHGILDPGIDFIQKPFSVEILGKRLRDVLGT